MRPSCSERDQHGHALVWGGMRCHLLVCAPCQCRCQQASHRPNYKGTASCKHGHLTVLQAVCVRRACSDRLGTHWCSAGCDAIFLPVLHGSTAPAGTTSKFGHPFTFSFAGLPHHCIMKMLVLHTCAHGFHSFEPPALSTDTSTATARSRRGVGGKSGSESHPGSFQGRGAQTLRVSYGAVLSLGFRVSILGF